jgi:protein CpxP
MRSQTIHRSTAVLPRLITVTAALLSSLAFAPKIHAQEGAPQAQEGRPRRDGNPEQRLERRVSRMAEELKLNSAQATKVRQILVEERTQMQALRDKNRAQGEANRDANRDAIRTQMRTIRGRTEQQIEGVLTAQQRTTYTQLREAHKKEHEGREGRRPRDQQPPAGR